MKSEEEIKERISYFEKCIINDVLNGAMTDYAARYYAIVINTLKDVLQEDNK